MLSRVIWVLNFWFWIKNIIRRFKTITLYSVNTLLMPKNCNQMKRDYENWLIPTNQFTIWELIFELGNSLRPKKVYFIWTRHNLQSCFIQYILKTHTMQSVYLHEKGGIHRLFNSSLLYFFATLKRF